MLYMLNLLVFVNFLQPLMEDLFYDFIENAGGKTDYFQ